MEATPEAARGRGPVRPQFCAGRARISRSGTSIYPVPAITDYERRKTCRGSFRAFCTTYFPRSFRRPWSDDHLRAMGKIVKAASEGRLFAFAMPRGNE